AILHHDGLAEHDAEPVGDDPRHAVGRSAGREWHDHPDRPVGIGLSVRVIDRAQHPAGAQQCRKQRFDHLGRSVFGPMLRTVILFWIARGYPAGLLRAPRAAASAQFHIRACTGTNRVVNMTVSSGISLSRPISMNDCLSAATAFGSNTPSSEKMPTSSS